MKALKITLAVLMVIQAGLFYAAFLQKWKAGPGHGAPSPAPQTMGDAAGAEAWAEVALRKMNYLKDPDSLVIEEASAYQPRDVAFHDWGRIFVSTVSFRARNSFNGSNRDICYVVWVPIESRHYVYTADLYKQLISWEDDSYLYAFPP